MMTYDRNRNAITTGSRVMISGTGHTGRIKAIETEGWMRRKFVVKKQSKWKAVKANLPR